jgi:hypothetical protein
LRDQVIRGSGSQASGWLLFIRDGMRAWGEALKSLPTMPGRLRGDALLSTRMVPGSIDDQVVQVLANMVLNLQQEMHYG